MTKGTEAAAREGPAMYDQKYDQLPATRGRVVPSYLLYCRTNVIASETATPPTGHEDYG